MNAARLVDEDHKIVCPREHINLTILYTYSVDADIQGVFERHEGAFREDAMSVVNACSSWLETLVLIAWMFIQTKEGGQAIASVGGLLIVMHYLRSGAVPGGRYVAVLLALVMAVALWALVLLALTSWEVDAGQKCAASPLLLRYAARVQQQR